MTFHMVFRSLCLASMAVITTSEKSMFVWWVNPSLCRSEVKVYCLPWLRFLVCRLSGQQKWQRYKSSKCRRRQFQRGISGCSVPSPQQMITDVKLLRVDTQIRHGRLTLLPHPRWRTFACGCYKWSLNHAPSCSQSRNQSYASSTPISSYL